MPLVEARYCCGFAKMILVACFSVMWFCIAMPSLAVAQKAEMTLVELQQQWKDLDSKLAAKELELKSSETPEEVRKEFYELMDQANVLIGKLKKTATAKLETEPDDPNVIRTLMGLMLNDAQYNREAEVLELGDTLIASGINPQYFEIASRSERLSIPSRELFDELIIRHSEAMAADLPRVKLKTTKGDIVLELYENEAPNSVKNFISLVESGYYTDSIFHRIIEGFMAQGGGFKLKDGKEVGGEGPGYEIECECGVPNRRLHFPGCLSMAHRGKDTGGSQFFITFSRTSFLDGKHTCFGRVVEGHDVLEALTRTHIGRERSKRGVEEPIPGIKKDRVLETMVIRKRNHPYVPKKVGDSEKTEDAAKVMEKPKTKSDAATDKSPQLKSMDAESGEPMDDKKSKDD